MNFKTEQESFWEGKFGDDYIKRNNEAIMVESNINFFNLSFKKADDIRTCIEYGANIGLNLKALKNIYPHLKIKGKKINKKACEELGKEIGDENPFIIGGGQLYKFAIKNKLVDIIYLTRIHANIEGDTFFPKLNLNEWEIMTKEFNKKDSKHKFDYTFLKFKKKL